MEIPKSLLAMSEFLTKNKSKLSDPQYLYISPFPYIKLLIPNNYNDNCYILPSKYNSDINDSRIIFDKNSENKADNETKTDIIPPIKNTK